MAMNDPIADMLTRIRNANTAKHDTVDVPYSKMKQNIADILLNEGFIKKLDIIEDAKGFKSLHIRCHAAQLASIRQMSGQGSRGSAGEYQADERAGVTRLSWRVSGR